MNVEHNRHYGRHKKMFASKLLIDDWRASIIQLNQMLPLKMLVAVLLLSVTAVVAPVAESSDDNIYHVDQGMAEEVVAVPHDAYIGYEVLRLKFSSSYDVSLPSDIERRAPPLEPRFRLLAESDHDNNLITIFASDSEDLERHAYEIVGQFDSLSVDSPMAVPSSTPPSSSLPGRRHFSLLSDGLLMTTRDLSDLVNKPVFLAVREDASPYYVHDRVFRINVYNNTRLSKVRFNEPSASGHIGENLPANTMVQGLDSLRLIDGDNVVRDGSVTFTLVTYDDDLSVGALSSWHLPTTNRLHHHTQLDSPTNPFRLANDSSISIVTKWPLDREFKPFYDLILMAHSLDGKFFAQIPLRIHVDDENDNSPVFSRSLYEFYVSHNTPLYSLIGNVSASDLDSSDSVVYHLTERHPNFVIVPKTGQLMMIKHSTRVPHRFELQVYATDDRVTAGDRRSSVPVPVIIEVYRDEESSVEEDTSQLSSESSAEDDEDQVEEVTDNVARARAKREIRHTKTYDYKESDGSTPGMVVFQLEGRTPHERFRLETPNKWVTVDSTGAVKVKEPWDYEQLGKDKTIDFWVIGAPDNGKSWHIAFPLNGILMIFFPVCARIMNRV